MTIRFKYLILLLVPVLLSCDEDRDDSTLEDGSYISMTVSPSASAKVGTKSYVAVTVKVPRDGAGETCAFTATGGSFHATESKQTTSAIVDINGEAVALWYPPATPGTHKVQAQIKVLYVEKDIVVEAVDQITITDLPSNLAVDTSVLFTIKVDPQWAGSTLELKTTGGILEAAGPVAEELEKGTKIKPILDQTGTAYVLFTSGDAPGSYLFTASLFGTLVSQAIEVE